MRLSDLWAGVERSVFRLETLDAYDVPEEAERLAAFLTGRAMPPRTPGNDPYLERVARLTAAGRTVARVHVVGQPHSDYVRYELACYAENVAAGEQVLIAERAGYLSNLVEDFWLFDDRTVALMRYSPEGTFLGIEDASDRLDDFLAQRDRAVAAAIPYDKYTRNEGPVAR